MVIRDKVQTDVTVTTVESNVQSDVPVVGITLATGYRYDPEISFDLGQQIGGPSAGLVFALAIYDKITDGPLLAGRHVAGTGKITPKEMSKPSAAFRRRSPQPRSLVPRPSSSRPAIAAISTVCVPP